MWYNNNKRTKEGSTVRNTTSDEPPTGTTPPDNDNSKGRKTARRAIDKFIVRFPTDLRARIARIANINRRSMNNEILSRLETSLLEESQTELFPGPDNTTMEPTPADLSALTQMEQQLIGTFRNLPDIKQRALIRLFT